MLHRLAAATALLAVLVAPSALVAETARAPSDEGQRRIVEVAFVLDSTGSMGPLIEGAKRSIWRIATAILDQNPAAEVRMGLVVYRDLGDDYVTRRFDLTRDIQGLYADLLAVQARGGGDWPESVNEALDQAVTRLTWTQGQHVDRIVFLVGDAPPHMDYPQDRKYPDVLADARVRGIRVNAVQAGRARDTARIWRDIAQRGDGRYLLVPQDGGRVSQIETPYDDEIIRLQIEINRTVVPYGSRAQQERMESQRGQVAAAPRAAASDLATYVNRAGGGRDAVTGAGDLVSDVLRGRTRLESVPDGDLPPPIRQLPVQERQAYLEARDAERQALSRRMTELTRQRDAHAREAERTRPRTDDAFDTAVREALQAQVRK